MKHLSWEDVLSVSTVSKAYHAEARTCPLRLPSLNIVDSLTSLRGISVGTATDVSILPHGADVGKLASFLSKVELCSHMRKQDLIK